MAEADVDIEAFGEAETDDEDFDEECRKILAGLQPEAKQAQVDTFDEEEISKDDVGEMMFNDIKKDSGAMAVSKELLRKGTATPPTRTRQQPEHTGMWPLK